MFKFKITHDRHNAIQNLNYCVLPHPPHFSLPSTFKCGSGIRILLLLKVIIIYDHCFKDPPGLHFKPPSLYFERPRLHFEPIKHLNFGSVRVRIRIKLFPLIRIRIQLPKLNADSGPDPQPCFYTYLFHNSLIKRTIDWNRMFFSKERCGSRRWRGPTAQLLRSAASTAAAQQLFHRRRRRSSRRSHRHCWRSTR
jgi:hypothetical protein